MPLKMQLKNLRSLDPTLSFKQDDIKAALVCHCKWHHSWNLSTEGIAAYAETVSKRWMTILSKCAAAGRKESPPAWYLKLFDLESQSSSESPAFDKDIKQTRIEELSKQRLPVPTIGCKTSTKG